MKRKGKEAGFTLVEVVVVVGVIAILAAILTPYITKYIEDSKIAKARNEAQVIGSAIANFYKDVGRWPNASNAQTTPNTNFAGIHTGAAANAPAAAMLGAAGWAAAGAANWNPIDTHLAQNAAGAPYHNYPTTGDLKWSGPYATALPLDPWGRPYVINAAQFIQNPPPAAQIPVWVLSAGPNGIVNTPVNAATTATQGDDIGFRIR